MSKPGKKIDTLIIMGDVDTVEVELRFSKHNGTFFVEYPTDTWHQDTDLAMLKKVVTAAVKKAEKLVWNRFIDISYRAEESIGNGTSYFYARHEHRTPKVVTAIHLHFEVWDVPNGHRPIGRKLTREPKDGKRAREDVGGDWYVERVEENDPAEMKRIRDKELPYTEARYWTLVAIGEGMLSLHQRFTALFKGDPDEVGRKLEGVGKLLDGDVHLLPGLVEGDD